MKSRRLVPVLLLTAVLAFVDTPVPAQTACADLVNFTGCTLGQVYESFYALEVSDSTGAESDAISALVNTNVATTAPDPFAGRIHSSYQDFLNLLSFGINKIEESEDGQSLIVRFNPLRQGTNLLGLSLTIAKPGVPSLVSEKIPEAQRAPTVEKIEQEKLGDLDDLTLAASYSAETKACTWEKIAQSRCWGRAYSTYRQMLASVFASIVGPVSSSSQRQSDLRRDLALAAPAGFVGDAFSIPVDDFSGQVRIQQIDRLRELAALDAASKTASDLGPLATRDGWEGLASLIDNQPQWAATVSHRDPGRYGGPRETAISLEYQGGFRDNLNSLAHKCQTGLESCFAREMLSLAQGQVPTGKLVLTASYKRRDAYSLADLELESPVEGFEAIDLDRSSELKVKAQFGWRVNPRLAGESSRIDFSLDGIRTEDDKVRTQDRWVATTTLTIPMGEQMSIPVSITYANKPEFLVDQQERLGMHVGLTYRLPWERGLRSNP